MKWTRKRGSGCRIRYHPSVTESTPVLPGAPAGAPWVTRGAALVGGAVLVVFAFHSHAWEFLCDDAYISFRYARNLADHGLLTFNVSPPEYVEGYTNFLWVMILAVGHWLGVECPTLAPMLTAVAAAISLALCAVLAADLRGESGVKLPDLVGPALLVAWPEFVVWSSGGLEGSTALALVLAACVAFNRGRVSWAAGAAAAAYLTRPDAVIPIAAYGLGWLGWQAGSSGRAGLATLRWGPLVRALAIFVGPVMAHLIWRRLYYGQWTPNTWTVKAHGQLLRNSWGVEYVRAWSSALYLVYLAPLLLLLRPRHLPALCVPLAVAGYAWWVGGDFMAYGRFLLPATAFVAIGVAVALGCGGDLLERKASRAMGSAMAVGIGFAVACGFGMKTRARWTKDMARSSGWLDGRWEGVAAMHRFARVRVAAGRWMGDHLPPETLVTVGAAGAMPYTAGLQTMDSYGLVDPGVARRPDVRPAVGRSARPGHQLQAPPAHVRSRDPDLLCHVGYAGPQRPGPRQLTGPFRRGYTWACVEIDPIHDRRVPGRMLDPGGFYCCRRPDDRVVGPFGQEVP